MMNNIDLIRFLRTHPCVSGFEELCGKKELSAILPDANNWKEDKNGNLFYLKKGKDSSKTLMIEAHRDTIGLCVKEHLGDSFYSVSACGGFDASILPGTLLKIITTGNNPVSAIAASKPPHVLSEEDRKKKAAISDIYVDTGIFQASVKVGDPVIFAAKTEDMANDRVVSPGLDNAVGVISLLSALQQIDEPCYDVLFLLSSSEETLSRGVISFMKDRNIHAAIILDAGFHRDRGLDETKCIIMGKGPSISITDTLDADMTRFVENTAKKHGIPLQIICEPGGTGTSATQIQLQSNGTPSAVISIPICNMHTPSEIAKLSDIDETAKLIVSLRKEDGLPSKEVFIS